jgi:hypothetical protein
MISRCQRIRYCWHALLVIALLSSLSSWGNLEPVVHSQLLIAVHAVPLPNPNTTTLVEDDSPQQLPMNTTNATSTSSSSKRSLSETTVPNTDLNQILLKAYRKALGGGIPGAIAGVVQVVTLMWLRTIINHQTRYGTSFYQSINFLYKEGGIGRFYNGLGFALFQAPVTRFVATASNDGVLSLLANLSATQHWGPGITTIFASVVVGFFRILLMPIDTCKVSV